jgi:hypothetical protein
MLRPSQVDVAVAVADAAPFADTDRADPAAEPIGADVI